MKILNKERLARASVLSIRTMDPAKLWQLIDSECGEELADFFLTYCISVIQSDRNRILENTASMLMMGYLIRVLEEKAAEGRAGEESLAPTQGRADA